MALKNGFHEVIPAHLLTSFDEKELELIVSGLGKVNVQDWKSYTRLKNCTPDSDLVKWFWQVSQSPSISCCCLYTLLSTLLSPP